MTTDRRTAATAKQVAYIMALLADAGFNTEWMDARYSTLGAGMRERSGRVEDWVASLSRARASEVIDRLKNRPST